MSKIALIGFKGVKLFPVTQNDAAGYEADAEPLSLPEAQSMTRDVDQSENKIYADDALYLNFKSFNGINATLTFAEMSLENIAALGFGTFEPTEKVLRANPQGRNKEFAMTILQAQADNNYRMYRFYSFAVSSCAESQANTKGENGGITTYQVTGTITPRKCDGRTYDVKITETPADLAWADSVGEPDDDEA